MSTSILPTIARCITVATSKRLPRTCWPARSIATDRCGSCIVIEGLPAGRTGMIVKLHHALLDGPSGAELMVQLLDAQPEPGHVPRATRPARC